MGLVDELRISDQSQIWRIVYHIADEAVVILEVFSRKTRKTPQKVIDACVDRLRRYRELTEEE